MRATIIALLLALLSEVPRAQAPSLAMSSFTVDAEGWVVEDFPPPLTNPPVSSGTYLPQYVPTGGGPGGFIRMVDPSGNWFWFSAPAAFLGNMSAAWGGTIVLDMRTDPYAGALGPVFPLVMLVGAGKTLFAVTTEPGITFTHFEIPLSACAWKVGDYTSGPPPTALDLLAVLSNLDALYVSGDWVDGIETADLDNVGIYGPSTPPAAEVVRLGVPPNPDALKPGLTIGPVLGSTWDPVIDHTTFLPTSIFDFLGIAAAPTNVSLPPLGTLLCAPPFLMTQGAPPGTPFAVQVPTDCAFAGVSLCTQGASITASSIVKLTNALDITLGTF